MNTYEVDDPGKFNLARGLKIESQSEALRTAAAMRVTFSAVRLAVRAAMGCEEWPIAIQMGEADFERVRSRLAHHYPQLHEQAPALGSVALQPTELV